jgi:MFS family permease
VLLSAGLAAGVLISGLPALLACWFLLGVGLSAVQTPAGRLIRRSARSEGRPALFAAQFSLSHLFWLFTYPLAGVAGQVFGLGATSGLLAALAALAVAIAALSWPNEPHDPDESLDPVGQGRGGGAAGTEAASVSPT